MTDQTLPERRHLRRLERNYTGTPVYLITICVAGRRPGFQDHALARCAIEAVTKTRLDLSWLVGRYVLMPDHLHMFCSPVAPDCELSEFVGRLKSVSTRAASACGWHGVLWQKEFHDHLLRGFGSYERKWQYVLQNPVRAGLCEHASDWPWSGVLDDF